MNENKMTRPHIRRQFIEQFGNAKQTPGEVADSLAEWISSNAEKLTKADVALLISVGAALMEHQLEAGWESEPSADGE